MSVRITHVLSYVCPYFALIVCCGRNWCSVQERIHCWTFVSVVLLMWTQIKLHSTCVCVLTPHDIASQEGLCTAAFSLRSTIFAVAAPARGRSVHGHGQQTLSGCCRSHQDTRAMPRNLPESNGLVAWQRASVLCTASIAWWRNVRWTQNLSTRRYSLSLSSMPSEALKHRASLTFKSGFLSFFLSGPKLIFKVSFAANFSVLN